MRNRRSVLIAIVLALTGQTALVHAQSHGPDIIVGELAGDNDILRRSTSGGITAYSFRTESCNIGDMEAFWYSNSNLHPVISQNMFRMMNGRFEQIGQAWVKHGFATVNNQLCGSCQPTDGDTLGVGCSDPYNALRNGIQTLLGPKSQVNASRGFFLYPFTAPGAPPGIGRRLQVHDSDLEGALNPGARYFIEGHYVSPDDSLWNNSANNASWREITMTPESPYIPSAIDETHQMEPAIMAWVLDNPSVQFAQIDMVDDGGAGYYGYFWVAAEATFLGGCQWHYEYAVQNLNSFQSGGTFTVDLPEGVTISNIGFHDVDYHSGEPYSGTNWPATVSPTAITWATQTFAQNPNANALRWATLYNFRFDANAPPTCYGNASIGLFRTPGITRSTLMLAPRAGPSCYKSGDIDQNCQVDGYDFGQLLEFYGSCEGAFYYHDQADMDDDGCIDLVDYQFWLARYREFVNDPEAPPPDPIYHFLPGDINRDHSVDQADVLALVEVLLGIDVDMEHRQAADLDGNGVTDALDIRPFISTFISG